MWLDVLQPRPFGGGNPGQRPDLVHDKVLDLLWRRLQLSPTEPDQIRQTRMCTEGKAMPYGQANSGAHDRRIARMKPAGDIGGGYMRHDTLVLTERVDTKRLAQITVEVNSEISHVPQKPKGPHIIVVPLTRRPGSPALSA